MITILIIEDDPAIAELIQLYGKNDGYRTIHVADGKEGLDLAFQIKPDAIVLDWMLPGMTGLEVLKALRKSSNIPVLMVTARSDELDKILTLEIGADDYIVKPFSPKELMARIKAILRRTAITEKDELKAIQIHDLTIDPDTFTVKQDKKNLELSALEFKLLTILASHPAHAFSREKLMEKLYDGEVSRVYDRTIDGHIKNLRKKLGDAPKKPRYIESIFGIGYKFKPESK